MCSIASHSRIAVSIASCLIAGRHNETLLTSTSSLSSASFGLSQLLQAYRKSISSRPIQLRKHRLGRSTTSLFTASNNHREDVESKASFLEVVDESPDVEHFWDRAQELWPSRFFRMTREAKLTAMRGEGGGGEVGYRHERRASDPVRYEARKYD